MFDEDYYLVCLDVTKKFMFLWFSKGPLNNRLRSRKTHELSSNLLNLNSYISTDFARKSRSIFLNYFNPFLNYARELLYFFVKSFQKIYGVHNTSHNIHNLLHLRDDYQNYRPLDNCFAFCFENFMKELKLFLRKS